MNDYLIRFIQKNKERYISNFKYRFLDNFLYFLLLDNEIQYIGHTKNIEFRLLQHYSNKNIDFNYFIFFKLSNYYKMIMKEKKYILKYKPKKNKYHKIKTQLNKNSRKWSYT